MSTISPFKESFDPSVHLLKHEVVLIFKGFDSGEKFMDLLMVCDVLFKKLS